MKYFRIIGRYLDAIPYSLLALVLRFVVGRPFFLSGQTKIEGPTFGGEYFGYDMTFQIPTSLRDSTLTLFENDYKLPFLSPESAALLTAGLEFILPVMLMLGLAARFSALGLLVMTLVIQFFVYPDAWWTVHVYWVTILSVLIARGPGKVSFDHLLFRN
ncbi:DoxX family protein [Methylocystis sp. MJC1]|jgi:putative oxidoreductase|uniref:DoxX family protein n=1 Tax=Methylocystis sp. MJC1 TaxID=2654282 RepID=UPI0013EDDA6B|nr:DoxX family protein [Methylocystis sp. MJC1]KAF2989865.1 hypothetical protein MJC1_03001 [Methylocystis sp. MJC1]MBU6528368.1 DoxX family protein [Methylocystis sp. MJC1]UZX11272.1 DoxX family protein [Methylocystis sp. MJC1]